MHNYVKFFNVLTDSYYDGFKIIDSNGVSKLCYPIGYLLLEKNNLLHHLNEKEISKSLLDLNIFSDGIYNHLERPDNYHFLNDNQWILNFKLIPEILPYINQISTFFEHIVYNGNDFQNGLIHAKSSISSAAPQEIISMLESFSLSNK